MACCPGLLEGGKSIVHLLCIRSSGLRFYAYTKHTQTSLPPDLLQAIIEGLGIAINKLTSPPPPGVPFNPATAGPGGMPMGPPGELLTHETTCVLHIHTNNVFCMENVAC